MLPKFFIGFSSDFIPFSFSSTTGTAGDVAGPLDSECVHLGAPDCVLPQRVGDHFPLRGTADDFPLGGPPGGLEKDAAADAQGVGGQAEEPQFRGAAT